MNDILSLMSHAHETENWKLRASPVARLTEREESALLDSLIESVIAYGADIGYHITTRSVKRVSLTTQHPFAVRSDVAHIQYVLNRIILAHGLRDTLCDTLKAKLAFPPPSTD